MGRLTGKVCIITGAASGMGLSAAKLFAKEGAIVIAGTNRAPFPAAALEETVNAEGKIVPHKITVSSEEDWEAVVAFALESFGKVDVLINNAGYNNPKWTNILGESAEDWIESFKANLMGQALGIKHVIPAMQRNGGGSIINTSSCSAYSPDMTTPACYCVVKGGISALTKHIAMEFAKDNIRVNNVIPGAFYTGMVEKLGVSWEQMKALFVEKAPLEPHAADPIEIAYAYLYLASDESKFVTGAELAVDGGMIV